MMPMKPPGAPAPMMPGVPMNAPQNGPGMGPPAKGGPMAQMLAKRKMQKGKAPQKKGAPPFAGKR